MNPIDAQLALARAAWDPDAAIDAMPHIVPDTAAIEAPTGILAPERYKALTFAVEVEPPPPHRRWRFFLFYWLVKLAARIYPFEFEIYRTREPWE